MPAGWLLVASLLALSQTGAGAEKPLGGAIGLSDPSAAIPGPGGFALAGEEGFGLSSPDRRFRLRLREVLQVDFRNFFGPFLLEPDRNSFLVNFAGVQLGAVAYERVETRIFVNYAQGHLTLLDAYLDVTLMSWLVLRVGKYPAPISEERLTPAPALPFVSTTFASFLLPSRETGIAVYGKLCAGRLSYNLSLSDGSVAGFNVDTAVDSGKQLIARLFVEPFRGVPGGFLERLGVGLGASTGDFVGTHDVALLPVLKSYGGATFLAFRPALPDGRPVVANGRLERLVPHAVWSLGPVAAYADAVWSRQQATSGTVLLRSWGVVANLVLTGETAAPLAFVVPAHPVGRGGWGTFLLVGGAGEISAPAGLLSTGLVGPDSMRRARVWGGGFNWYPVSGLAVITSYGHTIFDSFTRVARPPEDTLIIRAQLVL